MDALEVCSYLNQHPSLSPLILLKETTVKSFKLMVFGKRKRKIAELRLRQKVGTQVAHASIGLAQQPPKAILPCLPCDVTRSFGEQKLLQITAFESVFYTRKRITVDVAKFQGLYESSWNTARVDLAILADGHNRGRAYSLRDAR